MNIIRGGCYLVAMGPVKGRKKSKTFPVVVISNDKNNKFSATATALPITSKDLKKTYPFEVFLTKGTGNLPKDSKVKADQIRTFDKNRFVKFVGILEAGEIDSIEQAVKINDRDSDSFNFVFLSFDIFYDVADIT